MGSCERRARMAIKKARFRDGTGLHFMSASRLLDQSAMSLAALPCRGAALVAVSYTHLTLPTILLV